MNSNHEKPPKTYPFSTIGVYFSAILGGISIVLSLLLLLYEPLLLAYYLLVTSLIAAAALALKIRLLSRNLNANENLREDQHTAIGWRILLLFLIVLIAAVSLPILLTKVLDYRLWFILLISFISGMSISEILFYLYVNRAERYAKTFGKIS